MGCLHLGSKSEEVKIPVPTSQVVTPLSVSFLIKLE